MYALLLNRDEFLIEEILVEDILKALPGSFRYTVSLSGLKKGRIVAENGHCQVSLQVIQDDLWLFVSPKTASGIASFDAQRNYNRLSDYFKSFTLQVALPA